MKLVDKLWKSSNAFEKYFEYEEGLPVLTEKAALISAVVLLTVSIIALSWA